MAGATEVDRLLETLEGRYGVFPVDGGSVTRPTEAVEHLDRTGTTAVVDVWVDRIGPDEVLLYRPVGRPHLWDLPGGSVEDGDAVEETARREVEKTTGVDCEVTDVVGASRTTIVDEDGEYDPVETVTLELVARHTGGLPRAPEDSSVVHEADWFDSLPEEVSDAVERIADRV